MLHKLYFYTAQNASPDILLLKFNKYQRPVNVPISLVSLFAIITPNPVALSSQITVGLQTTLSVEFCSWSFFL